MNKRILNFVDFIDRSIQHGISLKMTNIKTNLEQICWFEGKIVKSHKNLVP